MRAGTSIVGFAFVYEDPDLGIDPERSRRLVHLFEQDHEPQSREVQHSRFEGDEAVSGEEEEHCYCHGLVVVGRPLYGSHNCEKPRLFVPVELALDSDEQVSLDILEYCLEEELNRDKQDSDY